MSAGGAIPVVPNRLEQLDEDAIYPAALVDLLGGHLEPELLHAYQIVVYPPSTR